MLIIAVVPGAGNTIVKVPPLTVKSPPKAKTAIALLLFVALYINAPFAVNDAELQAGLSESKYATVQQQCILLLILHSM